MAIDADLEARLRANLDRTEISALPLQYARGVQNKQPQLLVDCFSPDAELDYGFMTLSGIDQIRGFFLDREHRAKVPDNPIALDRTDVSTPLVINVHVDLDGDSAAMETVALVCHAGEREGRHTTLVRCVRYEDECVRLPAGWKMRKRRHRTLWSYEVYGEAGRGEG
jgi:hypothetical protein